LKTLTVKSEIMTGDSNQQSLADSISLARIPRPTGTYLTESYLHLLLDSLPIQAWALLSGGLPVDSYFATFLILAHNDWVGSHLPLKILTAVTVGNSTRSHFLTGVFPPTRDKKNNSTPIYLKLTTSPLMIYFRFKP
jgi:hypothetical protein